MPDPLPSSLERRSTLDSPSLEQSSKGGHDALSSIGFTGFLYSYSILRKWVKVKILSNQNMEEIMREQGLILQQRSKTWLKSEYVVMYV